MDHDIFLEVFDAKTALDGTRKSIAYGDGGVRDFELPPGDCMLDYKLDGTTGQIPFTVVTAERAEVPVALDASVLQVTTPTDDYVVYSKKGNVESETQITIKAGERFEPTVQAAAATTVGGKKK